MWSDTHATWRSWPDYDVGNAQLTYSVGVSCEMAGRPRRHEDGGALRERQREQQLIREAEFDRGAQIVMFAECGYRLVGNRLGGIVTLSNDARERSR